jgi:DNA-binding CsgD family transcriptional regulator
MPLSSPGPIIPDGSGADNGKPSERSRRPHRDGADDDLLSSRAVEILCRTALEGLFLVDNERRYLRINAHAAELLGALPGEILGRRIDDFTPPERLPRLEQLWAALTRNGALRGPYVVLRGDGSRSLAEFQATTDIRPGRHLVAARNLPAPGTGRRHGDALLTVREREVLQLAADGATTPDIAERLVLSPGTVKTHFRHIFEKLAVGDRAAAVAEGLRHALIT